MSVRSLIAAAAVLVAVPALAQGPDQKAIRNAQNWDTLVKLYPPRALAAREQGMVGFVVKLDSAGHPTECRVTHSSGYPLLDRETCDLITLHATFKRPEGISGSQVSVHEGIVNWKLPNSVTMVSNTTAPKAVAVAQAPEKKICRKTPKTGSLVATERVCMTTSQWKKASDDSKSMWEEIQGRKGSTSGN